MNFPIAARFLMFVLCASSCAPSQFGGVQPRVMTGRDPAPASNPSGMEASSERATLGLDAVRVQMDRAEKALTEGRKDAARSELISVIRALLAEGRMNPGDPRIDALFRASELIDRLGESDLAGCAWKRVLELRSGSYYPEDVHARSLAVDPVDRESHVAFTPEKPAEPVRAAPTGPTGADGGAEGATVAAGSPRKSGGGTSPVAGTSSGQEDLAAKREREDRILKRMSGQLSGDDPDLIEQLIVVAEIDAEMGRYDAADEGIAAAAAACKHSKTNDTPRFQGLRLALASLMQRRRQDAAAAEVFGDAVDSYGRTKDADDESLATTREAWAVSLAQLRDFARAQAELELAIRAHAKNGTPTAPAEEKLAGVIDERVKDQNTRGGTGISDEDRVRIEEILRGMALLRRTHPDQVRLKRELAAGLQQRCELGEALRVRLEILENLRASTSTRPDEISEARREIAALLRVLGRLDEARVVEQALADAQPQR
jgi:tetratricopeptide (TPR) repeat protein